jgi:hypothetical protein
MGWIILIMFAGIFAVLFWWMIKCYDDYYVLDKLLGKSYTPKLGAEDYVLVDFPTAQLFMEDERWKDCFCTSSNDVNDINSYYFIPKDFYYEIISK